MSENTGENAPQTPTGGEQQPASDPRHTASAETGQAEASTPQVPTTAPAATPATDARPLPPVPPLPTGGSFGASATQPTLPLTGSTPVASPASARRARTGRAGRTAALIVAAAVVGGAAGLGGAYAGNALWGGSSSTPAAGPSTVTVNSADGVTATTAIAAKVVPSVVTIEASSGGSGGTGSGVVLSADGYIVTNTHVVTLDGATGDAAIRVTTSDGDVYDAELIGTDPIYDLAVIKVDGVTDMSPIEFADSSSLNVGDEAVAVGAPLGLSNTVTTGIVSALNRSIEVASSAAPDSTEETTPDQEEQENGQGGPFFFDFGQGDTQASTSETIKVAVIQTDAAINPGNSGGALVDDEGKLIGINVAIASAGSSSGQAGSIGVGFSIPSNIVERIAEELIEDGAATHGLLGAQVTSAALVEGSSIAGAYIAEVTGDGAAAAAGLREGDIITGFNGVPITDQVDITAQVRAAAAGSDATVTYVRDGETLSVDVTLGDLGQ